MRSLIRWFIYAVLIVGVVVVITSAFQDIVEWMRSSFFKEKAANDGDVFAGVSAYFSAVAFGLLILTVILQAYELSLQRRELEDTRKVLSQQANTLELQQFDSTFFSLLSLHNEIVRGLVLIQRSVGHMQTTAGLMEVQSGESIRYEGKEVFPQLLHRLLLNLEGVKRANPEGSLESWYTQAYDRLFSAHRDLLGHYFRNLYHAVKFVDRSDIKNKRQYTSFLRAQLSGSEIELLFFNSKSEWGMGFQKLTVDYALLEHLPLKDCVPPELLLEYPRVAYGDNTALLHHYDRVEAERKTQAQSGSEINDRTGE